MNINTNEIKSKLFALYWGLEIFRYYTVEKLTPQSKSIKVDHISLYPTYSFNDGYLLLKDLSNITDEESKKVCELQEYLITDFPIHFCLKDEFTVCINSKISDNYEVVNINTIDYLRSRGYAVPFMGISVEQMIEWNWIKIETKNIN